MVQDFKKFLKTKDKDFIDATKEDLCIFTHSIAIQQSTYKYIGKWKYSTIATYISYTHNQQGMLKLQNLEKRVVFRLDTTKIREIKIIAAKKETTLNTLFVEGVDHVLDKYKSLLK